MAKQYVITPAGQQSQPQVLQVSPGQGVAGNSATPNNPANPSVPPVRELPRGPAEYVKNFIKSSGAIPIMWGVAMGLVFVDEWTTHRILARPARLWWTTVGYALLAIAAHFDPIRPIAVLIAIGLTVQLAYQFFNKEGQFTHGQ